MAKLLSNTMLAAGLCAVSWCAPASATAVYGTLGNFDVVNDTGSDAHGFEIDLEGIHSSDITDTFGGAGRYFPPSVERYGSPTITDTATGVIVTYKGTFSGGSWNVGTPSGVFTTPGESCWTGGGIGYGPSTPCDHFGVGTSKSPTSTSYSWLVDPTHSGTLTPVTASLPAPVWTVTPAPQPPPHQPPAPPFVAAAVQAPQPDGGDVFGTPEWVKIFTTQYDRPVALEDLMGGNGIVPQGPAETEIEWQLLQTEAGNPGAGLIENGGDAGANAESVVRRYEFYKYTGLLDLSGEALCDTPQQSADMNSCGSVFNPALGLYGVGDFIGAQNGAVNLNGVYAGPPIVTPEPLTLSLFGIGLAGVIGLRRRRVDK
jgi:hypothetical protein